MLHRLNPKLFRKTTLHHCIAILHVYSEQNTSHFCNMTRWPIWWLKWHHTDDKMNLLPQTIRVNYMPWCFFWVFNVVQVSAVQKLARVMQLQPGLRLYRGLGGDVSLPRRFYKPDEHGCWGFTELAFMSTTADKKASHRKKYWWYACRCTCYASIRRPSPQKAIDSQKAIDHWFKRGCLDSLFAVVYLGGFSGSTQLLGGEDQPGPSHGAWDPCGLGGSWSVHSSLLAISCGGGVPVGPWLLSRAGILCMINQSHSLVAAGSMSVSEADWQRLCGFW